MTNRILVVDDEEVICRLVVAVLGGVAGYAVFTARDGSEALRVAKAERPDAVVIELKLRGDNGYDVSRALKALPGMSHTRVLMMTGMPPSNDNEELAAGVDGFLRKPFTPDELIREVRNLLASPQR